MINKFIDLIYPNRCFSCNVILSNAKDILCVPCTGSLPFSHDYLLENNNFKQKIIPTIPIQFAFSLFSYPKNGISRNLIHELKYNNKPRIGNVLGEIFANQIKDYFVENKLDAIIYTPTSKKRESKRGYNQVETFAKIISEKLQVPVLENVIFREKYSRSQVENKKEERKINLENAFKLNEKVNLTAKHILILDDVCTTGSTVNSLMQTILNKYNVKFSLGVMVYND